jgi:hypothetical protein
MRLITPSFRIAGVIALAGVLAGLLACGGSNSPNASTTATPTIASGLTYTAPSATGYLLARDPSSTGTHLLLNLVGPQGAQVKGAVLSLNVDGAKVAWSNAGGSDPYIKEGQVLDLGTGTKLLKSQLSGSALQAAIFQKGSAPAATLGNQPLFSVALDLKAGISPGAIALSSSSAQILDAVGTTQAITVAVGSLSAQ